MRISANPVNCKTCRWVSLVEKTGFQAQRTLDYSPTDGNPFYPPPFPPIESLNDAPENHETWAQPTDWSVHGGTFSAVSVLGVPNFSDDTFQVKGAFAWGYSISARGTLVISGPTAAPGRISEAMEVMHQETPSWSPK